MTFKSIVECKFAQGQKLVGVSRGTKIISDILLKSNWCHLDNNPLLFEIVPVNHDSEVLSSEWKSDYQNMFVQLCQIQNPIVIGGDHSIGQPSVGSSLVKAGRPEDLLVIWVDAHGDANTFSESKSKNPHGMPVSGLLGLDNKWIDLTENILPENLLYFGIRDLDDFENFTIKKLNIFNTRKYVELIEKINSKINSNPNIKIHISFDVDSLDPNDFNATGLPVADGVKLHEINSLINFCVEKVGNNLLCFDIAEFNPEEGDLVKSINSLKQIF